MDKKKLNIIIICLSLLVFAILIFFNWKKISSLYGLSDQKIQLTYTTIENIKNESKLVTAKKQMDFITIMDGKDGRELAISTYEVKAGIDFSRYSTGNNGSYEIEIFSSDVIEKLEFRTEAERNNNAEDFRNQISPIEKAYKQKAVDYAVEYGILEQAKEKAEKIFKNLKIDIMNNNFSIVVPETKKIIELPYLPLKLEVTSESTSGRGVILDQYNNLRIKDQPTEKFNRDSLIFENDIMNWEIRIGDTGMETKGSFANVFKNVLETNANPENKGKDNVQLFRYYDPLYHKRIEVFSYASDYYRTFFLNYDGRIYYLDAGDKVSEQTLVDYVAPIMVYLATSIRPLETKVENKEEYRMYTTNYYNASRNVRDPLSNNRTDTEVKVKKLINSNINSEAITQDEKYFRCFSDLYNYGRDSNYLNIQLTDNKQIDEKTKLYKNLKSVTDFETEEKRDNYIKQAQSFNAIIADYLRAYYIQNMMKFNITDDEKNKYIGDLQTGTTIASRIVIAELDDTNRNEYFRNIFHKRLWDSLSTRDTASKSTDREKISSKYGDNLLFYYYDLPEFSKGAIDGAIYERIKKYNNGKDISNAFILVFNTKQFDFGKFSDNDIHAIVLDDATMSFYPNVASLNFIEQLKNKAELSFDNDILKTTAFINPKLALLIYGVEKFNDKNRVKQFYYGDWKNLHIDPENLSINNESIGTIKLTKKSKENYRDTEDYYQKSVIASVINDLQHSYSSEDSEYYYVQLCEMIKETIREEIYKEVYRPSPRMINEYYKDPNRRYNG